jgi:hypothetical protein
MDSGQLSGRRCQPGEHDASGQHLHRAADQRAGRGRQPAGQHRADAPADAGAEDNEDGQHRTARRPGEHRDPGYPDDQGEPAPQGDPLSVDNPVGQRHPQRHAGDKQRRQSRRQGLLRIRHPAVAKGEQQRAHHRHPAPLREPGRGAVRGRGRLRRLPAAGGEPRGRVEHRARRQVPRRGHRERRDGPVRHPDGQVSRTPDDPHHQERGPGGEGAGRAGQPAPPCAWHLRGGT